MHLETNRLLLRPIKLQDKEALFAYRSDAEANKYQGWIPKTLDETIAFIERLPQTTNIPGSWFQLSIVEKASNKLIGDIGIHFTNSENREVEIGCTLNKVYQHNGFAQEAFKRVIDYLFKDLKKHRIIASIDPDNTPSIRLVESIGFRKEAHFVESLWLNGEWVDDVVYAMLERDWEGLNADSGQ